MRTQINSLIFAFCTLFSVFFSTLMLSNDVFAKAQGEHPAGITELTIESSGQRMSGIIYTAAGEGVHPTMVLLHGYPGNEKNLDVAQAMRREGWNVIFFHYRGAWGSEGEFSFQNAEADVQAVLHYIMDSNVAKKLAIDTHKISIVGHSMGGHMALAGILDNPNVSCAVSYDGANMGKGLLSDPAIIKMWSDYSDQLFMLNGWSGKKMLTEVSEHGEALDLVSRVDSINGRPVFIIAANSDVIPLATQIIPLVSALKATKNSKISYLLIEDDHSFSSSRLQLISATASFLNTNCR
ncbi:alpha/beta hydrolase family protein [Colwellia sp. E150_009]